MNTVRPPKNKAAFHRTLYILEELKKHPDGISAVDLTKITGIKMQSPLSKLYLYGVIDRVVAPKRVKWESKRYLYRTKLPRIEAPPAAAAEPSSMILAEEADALSGE